MTDNLIKRIFTSLILSIILLTCIFLGKLSWITLVITASIISYLEFNKLVKIIWNKNKLLIYLINLISIFYLFFFSYLAYMLYIAGLNLIIFILLICILSDIGGYIIGKSIRGKKLTKISPNKTISGSVGSFIFSLIPIIFFLIIFNFTKNNDFKIDNYILSIILCLLTSLVSQLGDLFISYFKRKAKIKDTGSILPGHGGILDRIDGMLFALPVYAFITMFLNL
mgnify:CR=1 FL=1